MKKLLSLFTVYFCLLNMPAQAGAEVKKYWQAERSKLFTTPDERAKLEATRQLASTLALQAQEAKQGPKPQEAQRLPAQVLMQGYVQRHDGHKSTAWVNRQAIQENSASADVQIGSLLNQGQLGSDLLPLTLPSNGKEFKLKAGQSYLPDENRVVETLSYKK